MFNPTRVVIDSFVGRLRANYARIYGQQHSEYSDILEFVGRMALENIANSDAPYHDMEHTILVTSVGQEVLRGKHIVEGGVTPENWLSFVIALLCHDIGYVRGVCRGDRDPEFVIDEAGNTVTLPRGATDAALTPYHVARSRIFVKERFGQSDLIDHETIADDIDSTRFPLPEGEGTTENHTLHGLLRASDLIGQLADRDYLRKIPRLYVEFEENGANKKLGYKSSADLRENYPRFFWSQVSPYIDVALRYLNISQEGKSWVASLYSHVFVEEHKLSKDVS